MQLVSPRVRALLLGLLCAAPCCGLAQEKFGFDAGIELAAPPGWTLHRDTGTSYALTHRGDTESDATISVKLERRRSQSEAVKRLGEIAAEFPGGRYVLIAGWPALERVAEVPYQYPGQAGSMKPGKRERDIENEKMPRGAGHETSLRVTVAVAVGDRLVRMQALLRPGAPNARAEEALGLMRAMAAPAADTRQSDADLQKLRSGAHDAKPEAPQRHAPAMRERKISGSGEAGSGGAGAINVGSGGGEIEAAVSSDGRDMVSNASCWINYSNDGGATFPETAVSMEGVPGLLDGDCTVTWGPSGHFYLGRLGAWAFVALWRSTDRGANFSYLAPPVDRRGLDVPVNVDQPHLAADRWNPSASGEDRLYVAWQETGSFLARVACSKNGGATWGAPVDGNSGNFGYPRVAVGPDGMVYLVSRNGATIVIDKYSDCDAGLLSQPGFPVQIAIADVRCPVPGLDRCNNGNTLSSPTIAVDETDARHVFLGWAQTASAGQDIVIADSVDGGLTFRAPVAVNSAVPATRFMPWLATSGTTAYVGWYDRRAATASENDLTRYFRGSAKLVGGVLTAGSEFDLSGRDDAQCASGWPGGTRREDDSDSCSVQPQLAGYCSGTGQECNVNDTVSQCPAPTVCSSVNTISGVGLCTAPWLRCDFNDSANGCPAGIRCQTASGSPKYGDYNGLAVGGGRLLNVWASATAPQDLPAADSNRVRAYTAVTDLPSDFFVRDWTDNASAHDRGEEPSLRDDFQSTSDVWTQVSNAAAVPVNDWVRGENAQRGFDLTGENYAFARVSRRFPAPATAAEAPVSLHFLVSDFGLGMPFTAAGTDPDPVLFLAAGDLEKTLSPGYKWRLERGASTHICLAVEISALDDPAEPTLAGNIPGADRADPMVRGHNNKAQRNLLSVLGAGGGGLWTHVSVFQDALTDLEIRIVFRVPRSLVGRLRGATVGVAGGKRQPLREQGEIVIRNVAPGDYRYLTLEVGKLAGTAGEAVPVTFERVANGRVLSGASIDARIAPMQDVIDANLREHAGVLARLAHLHEEARTQAGDAAALLRKGGIGSAAYVSFIASHVRGLHELSRRVDKRSAALFGLSASAALFARAAAGKDPTAIGAAHQSFLGRLDAALTHARHAGGNAAAVLHNVRWQRELLAGSAREDARMVASLSADFISKWERRAVGPADFAKLVQESFAPLASAARAIAGRPVAEALSRLATARHGDVPALQKAHRDVLLVLAAAR